MPHSVPEIQVAESFVPKKILRQHEKQQNRAAATPGPGVAKDWVLLSGAGGVGGQPSEIRHHQPAPTAPVMVMPGHSHTWTLFWGRGWGGPSALEKA